jgi:hypothetical protein
MGLIVPVGFDSLVDELPITWVPSLGEPVQIAPGRGGSAVRDTDHPNRHNL